MQSRLDFVPIEDQSKISFDNTSSSIIFFHGQNGLKRGHSIMEHVTFEVKKLIMCARLYAKQYFNNTYLLYQSS